MDYKENWGHRYARLFRRVGHADMPARGALAHYDAATNILFIDADQWKDLTPAQQQTVMRTEGTLIGLQRFA